MTLDAKQSQMLLDNQGLIHYIIKKFDVTRNSFDYDDYESVAQYGLWKAAANFDESKNIKFATYASRCIENEIRMYLRKEKRHKGILSLDAPINTDSEGNEITIGDTICSPDVDFNEKIIVNELFIEVMNIILNCLKPELRSVVLYRLANVKQSIISQKLNLTQSYISRLEKQGLEKVKLYSNMSRHYNYKEVFSLSIENNLYQLKFCSSNTKPFNKVFSKVLRSLDLDTFPEFNVTADNNQVTISLPAEPESLFFIAEIIQEIDNFSLTFNKT